MICKHNTLFALVHGPHAPNHIFQKCPSYNPMGLKPLTMTCDSTTWLQSDGPRISDQELQLTDPGTLLRSAVDPAHDHHGSVV